MELECYVCGSKDETVQERHCGYVKEIHGETRLEVICDKCEEQHLWDI